MSRGSGGGGVRPSRCPAGDNGVLSGAGWMHLKFDLR